MTHDTREDPRIVRTRQAALTAIRELIQEGGWEAVTHQNIAEKSGYARSTIYRNWPERIDLLRELTNRAELDSHAPDLTGDVRTDVLADLASYRDVLFDKGGGVTLATILSLVEHSPEAREIHDAGVARGEGVVRGVLADAVARGELEADLDPIHGASELFGPVTHRRLMSRSRPNDDDLARIVDSFLHRWAVTKN